jgi:hypothetical protein
MRNASTGSCTSSAKVCSTKVSIADRSPVPAATTRWATGTPSAATTRAWWRVSSPGRLASNSCHSRSSAGVGAIV